MAVLGVVLGSNGRGIVDGQVVVLEVDLVVVDVVDLLVVNNEQK